MCILALRKCLEKVIYKKAKWISTISQSMKNKVVSKGIAEQKVFILPNWMNSGVNIKNGNRNKFRQQYGLKGKFLFLYSGNLGKKRTQQS